MDFRTCPACQASILEDDVDDCPFCGASLTGKTGSKPVPAKPASAKPTAKAGGTAAKAESVKTTARRAEPKPDDAEADPFEVDTSAVRDAYPISTKRTKTAPIPVTCPMCETSGFISPKLAGKDVKCCNPECMVPVFKAPPLPKKEVPVEEKPQGMSLASKITMGVLGVIAVIGAGIVYSIMTGEDDKPNGVGPIGPNVTDQDPEDSDSEPEPGPVVSGGPRHSLDHIRTESLSEMLLQAQRTNDNRSPPFCRQMVAEIQFALGNESAGREALGQLRRVAGGKLYFETAPLALLAWRHLAAADDATANAVLDEAVASATNLPTVGRQSLDDVTLLCAALCRAERWDDALTLVRTHRTRQPRGRMSAMWRGAHDFETFDFSIEMDLPYLMDMPDSLSVATTRTLCAYGAWDQAWLWTTKVEGVDVKHNCQAAWAGALTMVSHRSEDAALLARLDGVITQTEPVGQARMWAAVADSHMLFDKTADAQSAVASAMAALNEVETPSLAAVPEMRAIYSSKGVPFAGLTDPASLRSLALAWADVGHAHAGLDHDAEAWDAFSHSLDALRGTTPGPRATQALVDECSSQEAAVKRRLSDLGITDPNRTGFYQYRGQCEQLDLLADERLQWQTSLLTRAADLGLVEQAWQHIQDREATSLPLNAQEPWFTSTVPARIEMVARRVGQPSVMQSIQSTITPAPRPTPLEILDFHLLGITASTTPESIRSRFYDTYQNASVDDDLIDARYLDVVTELFHTRGVGDAFELARKGPTGTVIEDAFRLLTALAIVSGKQDAMWDAYLRERGRFNVTQKVATFRGLIDGILAVRDEESQ